MDRYQPLGAIPRLLATAILTSSHHKNAIKITSSRPKIAKIFGWGGAKPPPPDPPRALRAPRLRREALRAELTAVDRFYMVYPLGIPGTGTHGTGTRTGTGTCRDYSLDPPLREPAKTATPFS